VAKASDVSQWQEWLTLPEAARYLSAAGESVSEADVLRLAQEDVLQLSVRFLDTIYGQYKGVRPPYDENHPGRPPLTEGEVFNLPMIGAARLAVEEAYRRLMGQTHLVLNHSEALLVDDDMGNRFQLFHREGDYSPVTRLPDHAVLLLQREVLDQFATQAGGNDRADRPLDPRERETHHLVIAALCRVAGLPLSQPSKVARAIKDETTRLQGEPMRLRTLQILLKAVRQKFGVD
jgi:hypothetical protein